ncbi:MAG: lamin tail domain-containing protein [Rhodanobacteraceae bacterium]
MLKPFVRSLLGLALLASAAASPAQVVISQVYGGGGNSGATYTNDFIEVFNSGSAAVDLTGWSVQYASSTGSSWASTPLGSTMLQPGQYYLVEEAAGSGGTTPLSPDVSGSIAMSGSKGKIALVSTASALSGSCPTDASIQDFVGFGSANCSETSPVGSLSNTTAAIRNGSGCDDTGDNSADFTVAAPTPRNTASATNVCGGGSGITLSIGNVSASEGDSGTTDFTFTVTLSAAAPAGGVTFDIATADDTATTADNDYVANALTSQTIAAGNTTYDFIVVVNGDTTVEPDEQFSVNVSNIAGTGVSTSSASATGTIKNDDIPVLTIGAIQGDGENSPYVGQTVSTNGTSVVTAVGTSGFYMQDPDASSDGNPNTSDGIYVYTGGAPTYTSGGAAIAVGDIIAVIGQISEYNGTTEFGPSSTRTQNGSGIDVTTLATTLNTSLPSPDPTMPYCTGSLPSGNVAEGNWDCLESMLVYIDGVVVGATSGGFGADGTHPGLPREFYATVAGASRPFREPGVLFPGVGGSVPVWDGDPEIIEFFPAQAPGGPTSLTLDAGQQFTSLSVVGEYNGTYELYPATFTPGAAPTTVQPVPDAATGTLTIATQNMLHLFNDVDDPGTADDCTAQGDKDTCETTAQFNIRLQKLSLQVLTVLKKPAVLGVQEVENLATLQSLADQIHSDDPSVTYTPYLSEGNDVGGIDIGLLVRNDVTVNAVTQLGKNTTTSDGCGGTPPCILNDRPPLLLDASFAGKRFAVLVIHGRSLGGIDTARVRRKRLEQAQYVGEIVQAWQTGSSAPLSDGDVVPNPDPAVPIVVIGDFNAYEFTDGYVDVTGQIKGSAVQADNTDWEVPITSPSLCDANLTTDPDTRYSFVYSGYVQELDHTLLSRVAWNDFVSLHNAHGNADTSEAGSAVTDPGTPARSADHDGQVLTLTVDRLFGDGVDGDTCQ